MLSFDGSHMTS